MIRSFCIILKNKKISISEFEKNIFKKLKNNGEENWIFSYDEFWSWWKSKIEFKHSMSFSFVIFTDEAEFKIPKDINISKSFEFLAKDLKFFKSFSELNLISYPSGFSIDLSKIKDDKKEKLDTEIKGNEISRFYQKLTKEYESK